MATPHRSSINIETLTRSPRQMSKSNRGILFGFQQGVRLRVRQIRRRGCHQAVCKPFSIIFNIDWGGSFPEVGYYYQQCQVKRKLSGRAAATSSNLIDTEQNCWVCCLVQFTRIGPLVTHSPTLWLVPIQYTASPCFLRFTFNVPLHSHSAVPSDVRFTQTISKTVPDQLTQTMILQRVARQMR